MPKKKLEAEPKPQRPYVPVSFKVYEDEDPDLVEMLTEYPKTWIIKKALRFYRDHHEKAQTQPEEADATKLL